MKRVCVFCGSSAGAASRVRERRASAGAELWWRRLGLVYGGGRVGLMGVLADAMLAQGGEVIGVIPRPLATRELAHTGLTEMHVVESMHERKAPMASLADGFVALPGGLGTLRGDARDPDVVAARHPPQAGRRSQRRSATTRPLRSLLAHARA